MVRDFEHKRKSNGTANHSSVGNEQQFVELDGLLFAAEPACVERAQHTNNSATKDNRQLNKDEGPAPPARDQ